MFGEETPMIDLSTISSRSDLLDETLKGQLRQVLARMKQPVTLKAVVDMENQSSREMAAFLNVFSSLSDQLSLELYLPQEAGQVPELDVTYLPVTGLYQDGQYKRVAFHGIPGGKEINSFVAAVGNLAGAGKGVGFLLKKKIDKIRHKANLKICVSLSCHHCPGVVAACQQIALLNPNVEAEMIDARLYEDLVSRYQIERVPFIIVNDHDTYMGNKTAEDIADLLIY